MVTRRLSAQSQAEAIFAVPWRLGVEDAGRGFTPGAIAPGTGAGERVGLPGIRERVAMLGGRCLVESQLGAGTRVSVAVPLERPGADHSVN